MYRQAFEIGTDDYRSKQVFDAFYGDVKRNNLFAYASRIMPPPRNKFVIIVISDGEVVPDKLSELINKHLSLYPKINLNEDMWQMIAKRRKENQMKNKGSYEAIGQPTHIEYRTPQVRDRETKEILHSHNEQVEILKEEPYDQYLQQQQPAKAKKPSPQTDDRPFAVRYQVRVDTLASEHPEDIHLALYRELLRMMTRYLFTPSAIRLLLNVRDDEATQLPIPLDPVQIEIQHPTRIGNERYMKAINVYNMRSEEALKRLVKKEPGLTGIERFQPTGPDHYRLEVLDNAGELMGTEEYSAELNAWIYPDDHQCPHHACTKDEHGHVLPCEQCREATALITPWVRSATLIIHHEYALSPEPQPWKKERVEYTEEGVKRVGKGKNARLIKSVNTKAVEYRLVTFDAALPPSPPSTDTTRSEAQQEENEVKRANWLMQHRKEELIYKKVHFEDMHRTYSGPYYRQIIERCRERGGKFEEDGRTYKLSSNETGEPEVISSIIPFDKYIPMLEKTLTIRKVIDSRYEEEAAGENQEQ